MIVIKITTENRNAKYFFNKNNNLLAEEKVGECLQKLIKWG